MTSTIKISVNANKLIPNLLPCHIEHTGAAHTDMYFTPRKQQINDDGEIVTFFRGCKLVGRSIQFQNHTGYVVNKRVIDNGDSTDTIYENIGSFQYWNNLSHEIENSNSWDLVNEWDQLSSTIHD